MVVGREGGERGVDAFIAKDMDRYNLAHARAEGRPCLPSSARMRNTLLAEFTSVGSRFHPREVPYLDAHVSTASGRSTIGDRLKGQKDAEKALGRRRQHALLAYQCGWRAIVSGSRRCSCRTTCAHNFKRGIVRSVPLSKTQFPGMKPPLEKVFTRGPDFAANS